MTDTADAGRPRRPRRGRFVLLAAVLVVLACAGWLAWQAEQAKGNLHNAQNDLQTVKQALLAGHQQQAAAALAQAGTAATAADQETSGPLWAAATHVPGVGGAVHTARGIADAADRLVHGPLTTLVHTADQVDPKTIWDPEHGVAVDRLTRVAPDLTKAARQLTTLQSDVAGLPAHTVISSVDRARSALQQDLDDLTATVTRTARIARVAPTLLGARHAKTYLLVFQNPDEARGTGGLIGAYGILRAAHGRLHVVHLGPNTDLDSFDAPVIDLGDEFRQRYNGFGATRIWEQANASPHFPYAAQIWLAMWQQQTGHRLDGVIATDPVAMADLLRATGPATLPGGQQITAGNAVRATLHDAYQKYPTNAAQNAYFQRVAHAVVHQVFTGHADPAALVTQLGQAASQHRLLLYSTDARTEAELARTSLGGVLPNKPGPFAELVVDNIAGSKLDYYLDRSLTYDARGACGPGSRHTQVSVRLTNTAPGHGLPHYVTVRADNPTGHVRRGTEKLLVSVYLTRGASMDKVDIDGRQGMAGVSRERGHTVVSLPLSFAPGQTHTITVDVTEPASTTPPVVPVQPLVRPQHTTVHVPPC